MIMWAKHTLNHTSTLSHIAYETSKLWTGMVVQDLKLETSSKNSFLPFAPPVSAAYRGCFENGCAATIARHVVDLGCDTTAAAELIDSQLIDRVQNATPRAGRTDVIVRTLYTIGADFKYGKQA